MLINLISMQAALAKRKVDADVGEEGLSYKRSKDKEKAFITPPKPLVVSLEAMRIATVPTR